jgi:hypothetical protein
VQREQKHISSNLWFSCTYFARLEFHLVPFYWRQSSKDGIVLFQDDTKDLRACLTDLLPRRLLGTFLTMLVGILSGLFQVRGRNACDRGNGWWIVLRRSNLRADTHCSKDTQWGNCLRRSSIELWCRLQLMVGGACTGHVDYVTPSRPGTPADLHVPQVRCWASHPHHNLPLLPAGDQQLL